MSPTWGGDYPSMELDKIDIAFLTHIHSDHSGALADLVLTPWIMGRAVPLNLFGPIGLEAMSENITKAAGAIKGIDVCEAKNLSVLNLAPGGTLIRLTVFTKKAIEEIAEIKSRHLELMVTLK